MATRQIPIGPGLHTNPSAVSVPPGAMRQATGVIIHRAGTIQPRPGLGDGTNITSRLGKFRPVNAINYGGGVVVNAYDTDTAGWRLEHLDVDTQYKDGAGADQSVEPLYSALTPRCSMATARGNLYVATATGVRKLSAKADVNLVTAGAGTDYHTPLLSSREGTSDRHAVGTNKAVAYRYVWVKEDSNGYIRRSSASPRSVIRNTSATDTQIITLSRLYLPDGYAAGDRLELYRSIEVTDTSDPGDELFLAVNHYVTTAQASAGYIDVGEFFDATMEAELGPALYTNASQGGILQSNEVPPYCQCLAHWQNVMWFGNVKEREVLLVEPVQVFDSTRTEYTFDGIHFSTSNVDYSTGSPIITPADPSGWKVGQYITETGQPVVNTSGTWQDFVEGSRSYVPASTTIDTIISVISINNYLNLTDGDTITLDLSHTAASDQGLVYTWRTSATGNLEVDIGGSNSACAINLAAKLVAGFPKLGGAGSLTTIANDPATGDVTLSSDEGHGIKISISETTGGTTTVVYAATMSANAKGSASAESSDVRDYITINGEKFYFDQHETRIAHFEETTALDEPLEYYGLDIDTSASGGTGLDQIKFLANAMAETINAHAIRGTTLKVRAIMDEISPVKRFYSRYHTQYPGPAGIILIGEDPSVDLSFQVNVRPNSFRWRKSGQIDAPSGVSKGRLFWSKPAEPEAVPSTNFVDIGDCNEDILALVPLENALLVFKTDGVYRVTGSPPNAWRVDELDLSVKLHTPDMVQVIDNVCWAWTDRGLLALTEAGAVKGQDGRPIDFGTPIKDQLRLAQTNLIDMQAAGSTDLVAFWMGHHQRQGLLLLAVSTADQFEPTDIWCRNLETGAWTRWDDELYMAHWDKDEDRLLVSIGDSDRWDAWHERAEEGTAVHYDRVFDTTDFSAVAMSSHVIMWPTSDFRGYTPKAGDMIDWDGQKNFVRVLSVATNGPNFQITVEDEGIEDDTKHAILYESIECVMEWQAQTLPGRATRWAEAHYEWLDGTLLFTDHNVPLVVGGGTERDTSPTTFAITLLGEISHSAVTRAGVPRNVVRAKHFYPYLSITEAGTLWRLGGLQLEAQVTSHRVRR